MKHEKLERIVEEQLKRAQLADLMDYKTGEYIRPATSQEQKASQDAAKRDGGAGVIEVVIDGKRRSVYVED